MSCKAPGTLVSLLFLIPFLCYTFKSRIIDLVFMKVNGNYPRTYMLTNFCEQELSLLWR